MGAGLRFGEVARPQQNRRVLMWELVFPLSPWERAGVRASDRS